MIGYRIDREGRYVEAVYPPTVTGSDVARLLEDVSNEGAYEPSFALLVDTSALREFPPISDIRQMASELVKRRVHFRGRIAVFAPRAVTFGLVRMAAAFVEMGGVDVQVFADLERARTYALGPSSVG